MSRHISSSLIVPVRVMPRTGWKLPAIGVGPTDGATTFDGGQRAGNIFTAVVKQGRRFVLFDGDALGGTSTRRTKHADARIARLAAWEQNTVRKILATEKVQRKDFFVAAAFSAVGSSPEALQRRIEAALAELDCGQLDVVLLDISNADSTMLDDDILRVLRAVEGLVDAGKVRAYGLHAKDWHPLDPLPGSAAKVGVVLKAEASANPNAGTSLRRAFKLLRACGQRRAAVTPGLSGDPGEAHRCVAISSPASLHSPSVLLPTVVDASGAPWSVAQLAERYGMTLFLTSPLDCMLPAPDFEAAFDGGARDRERHPGEENRPFRCVDAPLHLDSHPSRVAPLLNDVVNFAIHLELMWEREVKKAVAEARQAEQPQDSQRTEQGGDSTSAGALSGAAAPSGELSVAPGEQLATGQSGVRAAAAYGEELVASGGIVGLPAGAAAAPSTLAGDDEPPSAVLQVSDLQPTDVAWAQILVARGAHPGFLTLTEWQHVKHLRIMPALTRLASVVQGVEVAREWAQAYRGLMGDLMGKMELVIEQLHGHQARTLSHQLLDLISQQVAASGAASGAAMSAAGPGPAAVASAPAALNVDGNWGRESTASLQSVVAQLMLSFPNAVLLSEVPELHEITTKASSRVAVEKEAAVILAGQASPSASTTAGNSAGGPASGADAAEGGAKVAAGAAAVSGEALSAPDRELPVLSVAVAQQVLVEVARRGLALRAATRPLPDWPDSLAGVPTQAELAGVQAQQAAAQGAKKSKHPGPALR
jgi:hypothetical protein